MVTDRVISVTPSIPLRPPQQCCDGCHTLLTRDAAWVEYKVDDAGKAYGFRLVHHDSARRGCYIYVGGYTNRRGLSLSAYLEADAAGVWDARILHGSVRNPKELTAFLLRARGFRYYTLS